MFRLIQAYPALCVNLAYSELRNVEPLCLEPCHNQNSLFKHYATMLRHIQTNSKPFATLVFAET